MRGTSSTPLTAKRLDSVIATSLRSTKRRMRAEIQIRPNRISVAMAVMPAPRRRLSVFRLSRLSRMTCSNRLWVSATAVVRFSPISLSASSGVSTNTITSLILNMAPNGLFSTVTTASGLRASSLLIRCSARSARSTGGAPRKLLRKTATSRLNTVAWAAAGASAATGGSAVNGSEVMARVGEDKHKPAISAAARTNGRLADMTEPGAVMWSSV